MMALRQISWPRGRQRMGSMCGVRRLAMFSTFGEKFPSFTAPRNRMSEVGDPHPEIIGPHVRLGIMVLDKAMPSRQYETPF